MQLPEVLSVVQPQSLPNNAGDTLRDFIPSEVTVDEQFSKSSHSLHLGLDLPALVYAAALALNNTSQPSVQLMGAGFCNKIFVVSFSDGAKAIARIPRKQTAQVSERIESQAATMTFVRCFLPGVPVPKVHAWNSTRTNPVGAPYVILDYVEGEELEFLWHQMPEDEKDHALREMALVYSKLSQPVPFSSLGNIMFNTKAMGTVTATALTSLFRIGPIIIGDRFYSWGQEDVDRPEAATWDLRSLWGQLYTPQCLWLTRQWGPLDPTSSVLIRPDKEYDEGVEPETYGHMSRTSHDVQKLFRSCSLPEEYLDGTLALADFAFRNVVYDPEAKKISGLIDWDEVHVLPLAVAVGYPEDISSFWGASPDWFQRTGGFRCIPPDEFSDSLVREDDDFRSERLAHTRYRTRWRELLGCLDPRLSAKFWKERELPAKIHSLAIEGARTWVSRRNWIQKQIGYSK